MPELSYDSVRVHNGMAVELWVCMFPGDFVSVATAEMVLLPPGGHVDRAVRAHSVRLAVRRGNEARMFVVRGGSYLHLERADQPRPGTSTTLGTAEGAGEAWHARIQDIECSLRTVSNERTLGSSWDVLPGPLFWRLPRNDRDVAFEEGGVLHAHHGHITLKVVRDLGADWRGQPTARVRVVQGGWHEGRLLHRGSMHVAKLLSTERAVVETVAAHKQLGGMLGPPAQVARLEYQLQLDFGPWLLLYEDFGRRMPEYLEEKGALSAEDVDRCVVDLLAALSAMHRQKLHHLALSPASILLRCAGIHRCKAVAFHARPLPVQLGLPRRDGFSFRRDAFGRLRLKLADLGVVERPSEPFPPGHHTRALAMSYVAPELEEPDRLAAAARLAVEAMAAPARKEAKVAKSVRLGPVNDLSLLPSLREVKWSVKDGVPEEQGESLYDGSCQDVVQIDDMKHWCENHLHCGGFAHCAETGEWYPTARSARFDPKRAKFVTDPEQTWQYFWMEDNEKHRKREKRRKAPCASVRELMDEIPAFAELSPEVFLKLCRDFEGPFRAKPGQHLFRQGDVGDYVYLVLAGEVETRRSGKVLCHHQRGSFVGEAALLGPRPAQRLCTAVARSGDCALFRMGHLDFREALDLRGGLSILAAPSYLRHLRRAELPPEQPLLADSFAAGALWCQLAAGPRPAPLARLRRTENIEGLRAAAAARDIGSFYFAVEERRAAALTGLLICRRMPEEVLQCLERSSGAADGGDEALESREPDGPAAVVARAVGEAQEAARSLVELNPAAELASDALLLSARAAESFADQWERLQNMATNRYGQFVGEFLGDLYGGLFAKDILWMFRAPSRTPRYPVLLVRDAEDGNLLARWRIAASIAFESELCERSAPLVVPSIRPAFTAGFQIGAAIGRNRAMNFKLLWIDAFLGSFFRQISAQVRIWLQRVKVTSVRWDKLGEGLREAVARGRSARVAILLRYGRLPTSYDQNAPRVLQLLPSTWVPDVGLPLADGIGRGFFRSFWSGWRDGRRKRYVRPRFEAWDLDDTPAALRDFARQQGAEQASLVASSVGDTLARDAGWHIGTVVGVTSGLLMVLCRRKVEVEDRIAVAGGRLQTDEDMAMAKYI